MTEDRKLSTDPDFAEVPDPPILTAVVDALAEATKALEGISSAYKVGGDNAVHLLEDGSEGPDKRDSCRDHHSQCGDWAKWVSCRPMPRRVPLSCPAHSGVSTARTD